MHEGSAPVGSDLVYAPLLSEVRSGVGGQCLRLMTDQFKGSIGGFVYNVIPWSRSLC
jgi:hypothetical protein